MIIKNICDWSLILEMLGAGCGGAHINPRTQEAEADGFLSSRPARTHSETMSQNQEEIIRKSSFWGLGWGRKTLNKTTNRLLETTQES